MFKNFAGAPNMVVTLADVEVIFYRISDLHKSHYQFVRDLEPKVANWSPEQQVADIFKVMVSSLRVRSVGQQRVSAKVDRRVKSGTGEEFGVKF